MYEETVRCTSALPVLGTRTIASNWVGFDICCALIAAVFPPIHSGRSIAFLKGGRERGRVGEGGGRFLVSYLYLQARSEDALHNLHWRSWLLHPCVFNRKLMVVNNKFRVGLEIDFAVKAHAVPGAPCVAHSAGW